MGVAGVGVVVVGVGVVGVGVVSGLGSWASAHEPSHDAHVGNFETLREGHEVRQGRERHVALTLVCRCHFSVRAFSARFRWAVETRYQARPESRKK